LAFSFAGKAARNTQAAPGAEKTKGAAGDALPRPS